MKDDKGQFQASHAFITDGIASFTVIKERKQCSLPHDTETCDSITVTRPSCRQNYLANQSLSKKCPAAKEGSATRPKQPNDDIRVNLLKTNLPEFHCASSFVSS